MNWQTAAAAALLALAGCGNDKSVVVAPGTDAFNKQAGDLATTKGETVGAASQAQPEVAQPEVVQLFSDGPAPTGVAVDHFGRIFVNYPRWGDPVAYSVAELKDGRAVPFPDDRMTKLDTAHPGDSLIGVQSVVTDGNGRLWIVDTGSINFAPVIPGAPKLVAVDLKTNQVVKKIMIPADVALPTTYLNDVRFDMGRGPGGTAYITDSSTTGPNGIIVVDLASGHSWRRLSDHPSTKAEPKFVATVEGQPFMGRASGKAPAYVTVGSDGIALAPDGKTLYYSPMSGHHLYTVDAAALADPAKSDADVAATVKDLGDRGFASDGLEFDAKGTLYLTDYEHNAIRTRSPGGTYNVLVSDPRMLWPDSMSVAKLSGVGDFVPPTTTNYLYFTCNQLERQPGYNNGDDLRKRPFVLFRVKIDGGPSHPGAKMMVMN